MRTDLKDRHYFDAYIQLNLDDIAFYEQCLKSADQKEERIPAIKHQVFNISLHTVIAQYSAGFSSEQMKDSFLDLIPRFEAGWCNTENNDNKIYFDGYIQALWMVSLAILLDVAVGDFQRIVNTLEGKNSQDMILDVLISTQLPRQKSEQLLYPQKFEFIKKLIDTQNIEGFKDYLDRKWYPSMKQTYWFDLDKNKNDVFFGYWSFESAAIVKLLKLDDTILKWQRYYPFDLIHQH
ncbi:DUF1911 domain-containing protein [Acinetobacter bereziniae]|uniref:PoNe immunity protein domain-containing protein n=1 Tax=Acinetobacter bereziniae TaxID=106648 RepID=UPI0019022F9A|nr:PoNe immunity protein domain-containing protein [Acinetobacter bereziniae]MBJ8450267.1 DUF1911 domain-containing protein [Acinetobacter bereziniae]MBJ8454698.1 DUF1911 domain-containing protein [Acinetobacter bereziniae]